MRTAPRAWRLGNGGPNAPPAVEGYGYVEFLTAHGWHTEAIRRDHYAIDGGPVDEVVMTYEI